VEDFQYGSSVKFGADAEHPNRFPVIPIALLFF